MQENKDNKEEKVVDVKGTFELFVEEEEPELSQVEAIKKYREGDVIQPKKSRKKASEDDDEVEDDEHLKRVKQALLESLERVDVLAQDIFKGNDKESLRDIKVNVKSKQKEKSREQIMNQMREKVQEDKERSREE